MPKNLEGISYFSQYSNQYVDIEEQVLLDFNISVPSSWVNNSDISVYLQGPIPMPLSKAQEAVKAAQKSNGYYSDSLLLKWIIENMLPADRPDYSYKVSIPYMKGSLVKSQNYYSIEQVYKNYNSNQLVFSYYAYNASTDKTQSMLSWIDLTKTLSDGSSSSAPNCAIIPLFYK